MEVLAIKLIEQLLEELSKDNAIVVSINGPLKDSATVAIPTFVGGIIGGPAGAVFGACAGTGILGISKALGFGNYKPLMQVLQEDFSQQERNDLYERLWNKLKGFVSCPLNQAALYSTIKELSQSVENNPEIMQNIRNELSSTFGKKHMLIQ